MDRRIVPDEPPAAAPQQAPGRLFARAGKRGRGVWRYSRGTLAALLHLKPSAIHSAERRGELVPGDLVSVSRFIARRLRWAERRRLKDNRRKLSVKQEPTT